LRVAHRLTVPWCVLSTESLTHLTPQPGPDPWLIVAPTEASMDVALAAAARLNSMGHRTRVALIDSAVQG
jgi:hypothetical protein